MSPQSAKYPKCLQNSFAKPVSSVHCLFHTPWRGSPDLHVGFPAEIPGEPPLLLPESVALFVQYPRSPLVRSAGDTIRLETPSMLCDRSDSVASDPSRLSDRP